MLRAAWMTVLTGKKKSLDYEPFQPSYIYMSVYFFDIVSVIVDPAVCHSIQDLKLNNVHLRPAPFLGAKRIVALVHFGKAFSDINSLTSQSNQLSHLYKLL